MSPTVSIIIVNWNGLALLQKCLPSVLATNYDNFEVVVVDNGSEDGSVDWLDRQDGVRVLRQEQNLGFCAGNNVGIRSVGSEFVVLLNNDVEVPTDWLSRLIEPVHRDPNIGAAQPKIIDYRHRDQFEYAGAAGGHIDGLGYPFARGRLFGTIERDSGQYDSTTNIFWASGAALLLRRSALDKVGLLDERLFMHMEEIDLCWRMWQSGYTVAVCPASTIFHMGGATLPQANPRKVYFNFRNSLLLLYKHSSRPSWPGLIAKRALLDSLAIAREIILLKPRNAWAILRAYFDSHKCKQQFEGDRPSKTDSAIQPSFRGSIVLEYFLRRRTKFSDLPQERFRPPFGDPRREEQ